MTAGETAPSNSNFFTLFMEMELAVIGSAGAEFLSVCLLNVQGDEVSAVAIEIRDKLRALGGPGPLKCTISKARERLSRVHSRYWRASQAAGRIKRFLYLEQEPSYEEIRDVRAAYVLMGPERIRKCREENAELIQSIVDFANAARGVDEAFYRAHLEEIRLALVRAGVEENGLGGFL